VAHADPAAELPTALCALDARFLIRGASGQRVLTAGDLFTGALSTALSPGELLIAIEVPDPPPGARMGFAEHARTHGDFAVAGAAVVLAPEGRSSVTLLGADSVPRRDTIVEGALHEGMGPMQAADHAGHDVADPYRRALLRAMTRRAVHEALHSPPSARP
jgi:CO/xanthine dehydrogenase FAD-binding subunit